ncbi:ATP-binding protein [Echinimonas agarilytica]|uniref:ATP-binding protein n=1 Tax=Echinimonas agarilytica TaxID=1215918 RepID=A0AA41W615_9GAMM|nr:ATP-binding protein [Echinimonas agarilytica]MCM2679587.1 ATP-binding protein [Echinimonas agarilytica]
MTGLLRIILIDTHLPGVVELKLKGHTNICGTNASGKTTLQRLLPVFYGEAPSRVVPSTRDSFQAWYLPRTSSFIIYEYQRADGQMCMAVLTSSSTGVVYRLIHKTFEMDDFVRVDLTGESSSIPLVEIIRNCKNAGVMTSKKLNTKEFRAVIQNDRVVMNSSSEKRNLISDARFFSVCESGHNLRHIEKLIKAVHSKEGKMETIKAMIAAILEEEGVSTPNSRISRAKVDEWIKECQLIAEFDGLRPQFKALQQSDIQLQQTEQRLSDLAFSLNLDVSQLNQMLTQDEDALSTLKATLQQVTEDWEQAREQLQEALSSAQGDVQSSEQRLDQIELEFDDWMDKDIETHRDNIEKLPQWQSDVDAAQQTHALLTEQHQDIEAAYNRQLAEIEERHNKEQSAQNKQRSTLNDALHRNQLNAKSDLQELQQQQQLDRQQVQDDFARQAQDIQLQLSELTTKLSHASFTEQELGAQNLIEAALDEAVQQEDYSREALHQQQKLQAELKREQDQLNEQLTSARQRVAKCVQHVENIETLLYPAENTLLGFLRTQHQGWEHYVGKVIHPDLLIRTDLNPRVIEDASTTPSLYGLRLDTDAIEVPEMVQTEAQLQLRLTQAHDDHQAELNAQQQLEAELGRFNQQLRDKEKLLTSLQSQLAIAGQSRQRMLDEKRQLIAEHRQALSARKTEQQKRVDEAKQALQKLASRKADALEQVDDQAQDALIEKKAHWEQITGDYEAQIETLDEQIKQAHTAYRQSRKESEKWLKDQLAERDVDVDKISELKQKIRDLKSRIEVTHRHRDAVLDYKRWHQLVFTNEKNQFQQKLTDARQKSGTTQRALDEKRQQFKQHQQAHKEQISSLDRSIGVTKEVVRNIQSQLKQLALLDLAKSTGSEIQGSPAQRASECQQLIEQQAKLLSQVEQHIRYFDNSIGQKAGTSLSDIWEQSRSECMVDNGLGVMLPDARRMVTHLDQLLNVIVPQKIEGLRTLGRNFGNDLSQYYHILSDIDKRIAQQSRRISKEVDEELFLDGVSESSVKIRSRISELEFWPELQRFNQLHQHWLQQESQILPDEDYAHAMRTVLDILGRAVLQGGISQLLDIELHLKEGASHLVIRTDKQLNESSSHGMAYLILCKFLLAFTRLLRGDSKATIHWPIDEIGTLANHNVAKIFDACANNQITVLGAFPNPDSEVLNLFENRYLIDKEKRRLQIVQPKLSAISQRIQQAAQAGSSKEVAS